MSLATGAAPRPGPLAARGASATAYRPEIDGVRALAVVAVVAYHAGVPGFSGGYVGVDRDDSHLTAVYAERLAPRLAELVGLGLPGDNPLVAAEG